MRDIHQNSLSSPLLKKKKKGDARMRSSVGNVSVKDHVPDDIVLKILKELPAKSLLRFRSVCKSWQCMIDDPYFHEMHRLRSHQRHGGVKLLGFQARRWDDKKDSFLLIDHHQQGCGCGGGGGAENIQKVEIVPDPDPSDDYFKAPKMINYPYYRDCAYQAVEGLILFNNMLWNPTTRKCFHIPPQHLMIDNTNTFQMSIGAGVYRPILNNFYFLGFDSVSQEYKILGIMCDYLAGYEEYFCQMQVMTVRGGGKGIRSWTDISHNIVPKEAIEHIRVCQGDTQYLYLNNKIYILVKYQERYTLMVFYLGEESFRLKPLPFSNKVYMWEMIEVRGCFALIRKNEPNIKGTTIWRLINEEEEGEAQWEEIVYQTWPNKFPHYTTRDEEYLMRCKISDTENLVQIWDDKKKKVISYCWDIGENNIREAPNLILRHNTRGCYIFSQLVETLFHPTALQSPHPNLLLK